MSSVEFKVFIPVLSVCESETWLTKNYKFIEDVDDDRIHRVRILEDDLRNFESCVSDEIEQTDKPFRAYTVESESDGNFDSNAMKKHAIVFLLLRRERIRRIRESQRGRYKKKCCCN